MYSKIISAIRKSFPLETYFSKRIESVYPSIIDSRINLLGIHSFFSALFNLMGPALLLFGLSLWLIVPILGLFPILIYAQASLSNQVYQNRIPKTKILILLIVLFTLTCYSSSIFRYGDTAVYISVNKELLTHPFFEYLDEIDLEPVSFVVPRFISILTNGDPSWFLLTQSLSMNLATIAYAVFFLPQIYPLIIFVNIAAGGWMLQLFYMRQAYALIFLIPAIHTRHIWLKVLLAFLALKTHSSSLIFLIPLLLSQIFLLSSTINDKKKTSTAKPKQVIFGLFFVVLASVPIFYNPLISYFGSALDSLGSENLQVRLDRYQDIIGWDVSLINLIIPLSNAFLILFFILRSSFRYKSREFFDWLFCSLSVISSLAWSILSISFLGRAVWYLNAVPGFFYFTIFLSEKLSSKKLNIFSLSLMLAVVFQLLIFVYRLIRSQELSESLVGQFVTFWDGRPLDADITDYFLLLKETAFPS